jgi:RPA family protein
MTEDKVRQTAKKVRICDVVNGKFIGGSKEDMIPSFVITPFGQKISRVNVVGVVTDKFMNEDESYGSITIDDSTAAIRAKVFREDIGLVKSVAPGETVLVFGKLKDYAGEVYINAEVIKENEDRNIESMKKLEILNELIEYKKIRDEIKELSENMPEEELREYAKNKYDIDSDVLRFVIEKVSAEKRTDYKPKIMKLIKSLDKGDGVEISKILQLSDLPENILESAIDELLSAGDLFEPNAGVLKAVE